MKTIFIVAVSAIIILSSCNKDSGSDIQAGDTGSLILEFDNVVGSNDLQLNTGNYTNGSGESFTISTLDYYISNIILSKSDGTGYVVPKDESYFLIKEEDEDSHEIELENVPAGDYTSFTFVVGVDSLKNTAPVEERTGVLDPSGAANGMYWSSNSGYIFLKMEGTSPVSTAADQKVSYHVGGFGGYSSPTLNNIKTVTITAPFESNAKVRKGKPTPPEVHIFVDAGKILDGTSHVSIAQYPMVDSSDISASIANNYAAMFSIDHIHND